MKIGIFGIDGFSQGKANIVDQRVKTLEQMFKSAKQVFIQADILTQEDKLKEADGIISLEESRLVLVMTDLEFVELRLSRGAEALEKELLLRAKDCLSKENMLSTLELTEEEKKISAAFPFLTNKPIFFCKPEDAQEKEKLLFNAYYGFGYISFFTAGDKDAHAWSIKKGANAYESAGCIHSDIQKGFIRAEVLSYDDLIKDGGLSQARQNNHIRLENKEYIVQDGDYIVFKCNK
ncbi:MAG: DUF933 domain-containing protein [Candidatus Omnitrophica bacterium]|jgi:hypothetical protein|nr:DUF933 domain-containing protein [Candidatus Omnitrophota bacterium]